LNRRIAAALSLRCRSFQLSLLLARKDEKSRQNNFRPAPRSGKGRQDRVWLSVLMPQGT